MTELIESTSDVLAKIEISAAAMKPCPKCGEAGKVVPSGSPVRGIHRLAVQHFHADWCPHHEDFRGAVG